MRLDKLVLLLLATSAINSVWCHHHHHHHHDVHPSDQKKRKDQVDYVKGHGPRDEANSVHLVREKNRRSLNMQEVKETSGIPYSHRRMEKMLEKAILKIITGDLSAGDMLLLKSLNYSLEEVLAIRERELSKKKDDELRKKESTKSWTKTLYGEGGEKKTRYWDKNSMDRSSSRNPDYEDTRNEGKKNRHTDKSSYKDFDFDAYNRQAVLDYENLPTNPEFQQSWSESAALDYEETTEPSKEQDTTNNFRRDFDEAMASHVVFKIRYDDSEFDSSSGSDETNKYRSSTLTNHVGTTLKHTTSRSTGSSFHALPSTTVSPAGLTSVPPSVVHQLTNSNAIQVNYLKNHIYDSITSSSTSNPVSTTKTSMPDKISNSEDKTNAIVHTTRTNDEVVPKIEEKPSGNKKVSEYEGLEWVEDDVYRVIPGFVDSLGYENTEENETSDYENSSHSSAHEWNTEESENDTMKYQNEMPDSVKLFMANNNASAISLPFTNLSAYQQVALMHRRDQGEKAIEDIKSRVLALTGRFNNISNANQVQREKLTMFSPTCQVPRNTDQDAWADSFSMNLHFHLNLTFGDHVVAAKLRIYKLPQANLTSSADAAFEGEEEDEKIRISVYYYTKSLKKHRSKKRLMDSVVTSLTSDGTHLALDVRQGLRFWRPNPRNSHGNSSNHGLVVQVEDQDGRPLKPALYIQQPSCTGHDSDQKAYQRVPALFVRACTRYVRIVNGKTETYVNCRH